MSTRESRAKVIADEQVEAMYETFMAGFKRSRPDLSYPESKSDMQSGLYAIHRMFKIERRPLVDFVADHEEGASE